MTLLRSEATVTMTVTYDVFLLQLSELLSTKSKF